MREVGPAQASQLEQASPSLKPLRRVLGLEPGQRLSAQRQVLVLVPLRLELRRLEQRPPPPELG